MMYIWLITQSNQTRTKSVVIMGIARDSLTLAFVCTFLIKNTAKVDKATRRHQKHPFQAKKEIRRGEISKNQKGFSGGAQHSSAVLGGAAQRVSFLC